MKTYAFLCLLLTCLAASAATITVTNSYANAAAAEAGLSAGDTLVLVGTATFTNNFLPTKNITISGTPDGLTQIADGIPNASRSSVIAFLNTINDGNVARITGITFTRSPSATSPNDFGLVQCNGLTKAFRVDHCTFDHPAGHCIVTSQGACGVIDHNIVKINNAGENYYFVRVFHQNFGGFSYDYGDGSWYLPLTPGGTNAVYIESNSITNGQYNAATTDGFAGARIVFRYNSVTNGYFNSHGTESSGRLRGTVWCESYMNRHVNLGDGLGFYYPFANFFRSGSGLVWSNTYLNFSSLAAHVDYNMITPFWVGDGWNGTNAWCTNGPLALTGTATDGGTFSPNDMSDTSQTWTTDQWVGYTLINKSRTNVSGGVQYAPILGNDPFTITFASAEFITDMSFSAGDIYEIRQVIRSMDQPGNGPGDLLSGDFPNPVPMQWLNQTNYGIWYWKNTLNGNPVNASLISGYYNIKLNRDIFNSQKSYTPLVYPHPLVGAAEQPIPPPIVVTGKVTLRGVNLRSTL